MGMSEERIMLSFHKFMMWFIALIILLYHACETNAKILSWFGFVKGLQWFQVLGWLRFTLVWLYFRLVDFLSWIILNVVKDSLPLCVFDSFLSRFHGGGNVLDFPILSFKKSKTSILKERNF